VSAHGPIGSAATPLTLTCAQQSAGAAGPAPGDLVVGPLDLIAGKTLATANPSLYGESGRYKVPITVRSGATVTMAIGAQALGHVVIDNPNGPSSGVTAVIYHSCPTGWTSFPQGFVFTDGRTRGCVPLDVSIAGQPPTRHVTVSLFAGSCPA
jgi:hypothetical protein